MDNIADSDLIPDTVNGAAIPARLADRVSIIGFADGHRDHAPWAEVGEFWGMNRLHVVLKDKPWTRWFELHSLEEFYADDEQHKAFLRQAKFPIYIRPQDMAIAQQWGITAAVPYPIEAAMNLPGMKRPYYTNTVSWLVVLAELMGFPEVHLYGVDMAQDNLIQAEYSQQRPSCEYYLGRLEAKGVDVFLPEGSDLLMSATLYGFDDQRLRKKLLARLQEIGQRKEEMRAQMNEAQNQGAWFQARISELDGVMQEIQYQLRNLHPESPSPYGGNEQ
jgi:hypothetical protein